MVSTTQVTKARSTLDKTAKPNVTRECWRKLFPLVYAGLNVLILLFVLSLSTPIDLEMTCHLSGRKFDNGGELIRNDTGWSKLSIKHFKEKAQCLVKQFGKYKVLNKFHVRSFHNYTLYSYTLRQTYCYYLLRPFTKLFL
jgi:hypothetical protein